MCCELKVKKSVSKRLLQKKADIKISAFLYLILMLENITKAKHKLINMLTCVKILSCYSNLITEFA